MTSLRASGASLGSFSEPSEGFLEASWGLLRASWELLSHLWSLVGVLGASGGFAVACCAPYGAVWRVWRAAWTHLGTILKAFSSILNYLRQIWVVFDLTFLTVFTMDSAPGGHFALYFTIKSLNRAENRRRKRCRSKVLGFGLSGTVLGRSGAVCEALKKAPRTYGGTWEFATGVHQGGGLGPARESTS